MGDGSVPVRLRAGNATRKWVLVVGLVVHPPAEDSVERSLSHTRAARVLRAYQAISHRARGLGIHRLLIEDIELEGDSVILGGKRVLNFGLCSYLGLGNDERLVNAATQAIKRYGTSYSSSLAYTAVPLYRELSERLASMFDSRVVLAPTTTLAHLAALPVLIRPEDVAVVDVQAHASVRMATQVLQANGVKVVTVPHSNTEEAEAAISRYEDFGKVWLLTDGIYSMYGDITPAIQISQLLDRHSNLWVYCDDAHGFGWDGKHGRGSYLARAAWHPRLVVSAGLSKSFGATGGVIATIDEDLAEKVEATAAPLIFGGPIPPAALGAGVASADIHLSSEHEELQSELMKRIDFVNRFAGEIGLPLADLSPTPLWFYELGNPFKVMELLVALKEDGFFLNGATFPVVPLGHAGVRFTVTNYLSLQQIEDMLLRLQERRLEVVGETEIEIDLTDAAPEQTIPAGEESEGVRD